MINRVTDYLPRVESRGRPDSPARSSLSSQDIRQWVEPVEEMIVKYPAAALASAFVIGVAVAWWIKRT
jgi:hypothetical protein